MELYVDGERASWLAYFRVAVVDTLLWMFRDLGVRK